jgi:non-homologous end joining protein Ku
MRIIKAKLKGKKADLEPMQEAEPADEQVIDLMSRLRESLEQGKKQPSRAKRARSGTVRAPRKAAASRERTPPKSRRSA